MWTKETPRCEQCGDTAATVYEVTSFDKKLWVCAYCYSRVLDLMNEDIEPPFGIHWEGYIPPREEVKDG